MQFLLRVDDIGWSPEYQDKTDRGLRLAQDFHRKLGGLPHLGAVISEFVDQDGLAWLKSKPVGMKVALHGLNHTPGEFRNLTLADCRARIRRGKAALEDALLEDVVLPFNQYETGLAEACRTEGIRRIWGGGHHLITEPSRWPAPPAPYPLEHLCFVPSWRPTYAATLWRMRADIRPLSEILPGLFELPGKAVITIHVTWEKGLSKDLKGIQWLADTIGGHLIGVEDYLNAL